METGYLSNGTALGSYQEERAHGRQRYRRTHGIATGTFGMSGMEFLGFLQLDNMSKNTNKYGFRVLLVKGNAGFFF